MFLSMMIWRWGQMSSQVITRHMVEFIEEKEKEIQADRLNAGNRLKKNVVQSILDELDAEVKNENQKD
mgnify:CR=1 FL=1